MEDNRTMDKTRKKRIKRYIAWGCAAALVVVLAVMPLLAAENAEDSGPVSTIKSGQVSTGSITTTLGGGGTLTESDAIDITIPSGVKLTGFLVDNGDAVKEGDALAAVDKISVMTAIAQIQETLDYLADEIESAEDDTAATSVKAQTAGKVKVVYAETGDNVQDVMLAHGALAVLSLDGRMALDLETDADLKVGDSVLVSVGENDEVTGHVESTLGNTLIITVPDDGYDVDAPAAVSTTDGEYLGYSKLYIYNSWKATAYYGTVSAVNITENQNVSSGTNLFTLTDTDHSTAYELLISQRQEYEEVMAALFKMYQSGTVTAPCDGIVSGVEEDSPYLLAAEDSGWTITLLSNTSGEYEIVLLADEENGTGEEDGGTGEDSGDTGADGGDSGGGSGEGGDGEETPAEPVSYTGILAYAVAAEDGSVSFLTNNTTVTISDTNQVTQEQMDTSKMTTPYTSYRGNGYLYVILDGEAQLTASKVSGGSIVLIVNDEMLISLGSTTSGGTGGDKPGSEMSGSMSGAMSGMGGFGGSGGTTVTFEPYDLTEYTILSVTPDDAMSLDISVDELDIGKVSRGQEVQITVSALNTGTVGTVTSIGSAENNGGNSKFTVTITMDRGENMLAGMSASASMTLGTVENVLVIPAAALNDDGSEAFVYTGYDKSKEMLKDPVTVTVGASDGEYVQILSGLEEGDTYYYAYYDAQEME